MREYVRRRALSLASILAVFHLLLLNITPAQEATLSCVKFKNVACLSASKTRQLATKTVLPEFPKSCRCLGLVRIYVKVDKAGKIVSAVAKRGHPLLRMASVEAIEKWEFKAYKKRGRSFEFVGKVDFRFTSDGSVTFMEN